MRTLGIDPGSRRLGWGIVEPRGSRLVHVASGTLQATGSTLVARMVSIVDALCVHVETYRPARLAIEKAFAGDNVHSALVLGQIRGAVLVAMGQRGLSVAEYAPSVIKLATTGTGRADKQQVQHMVRMLLRLGDTPMGHDTSDALAVAVCHAQRADSVFARVTTQERT